MKGTSIAILVVLVGILIAIVSFSILSTTSTTSSSYSQTSTTSSISTSSNTLTNSSQTSNNNATVTRKTTVQQYCSGIATNWTQGRGLLNYSALESLLSQNLVSSCLDKADNTIYVTYGYNPCIVSLYVLPNGTNVDEYIGLQVSNETCV